MLDFTPDEVLSLSQILKQVTSTYDKLFAVPFPYSMGFHPAPTDNLDHAEWHFHAHFYPPLLRSATVRKFMLGFELLGTPQRHITAEAAAAGTAVGCASEAIPRQIFRRKITLYFRGLSARNLVESEQTFAPT